MRTSTRTLIFPTRPPETITVGRNAQAHAFARLRRTLSRADNGNCGLNAVSVATYATADCTGAATPDALSARLLNGFIAGYHNHCVPVTVSGEIYGYSKYTCTDGPGSTPGSGGTNGSNSAGNVCPSAWVGAPRGRQRRRGADRRCALMKSRAFINPPGGAGGCDTASPIRVYFHLQERGQLARVPVENDWGTTTWVAMANKYILGRGLEI